MIARASSGSCSRWGRIAGCTAGGPPEQPGRAHLSRQSCSHVGSVAEWSIAPVLKTGNGQPFVSSNLTASANIPAPFSVISASVFSPGVACALHRGGYKLGLVRFSGINHFIFNIKENKEASFENIIDLVKKYLSNEEYSAFKIIFFDSANSVDRKSDV